MRKNGKKRNVSSFNSAYRVPLIGVSILAISHLPAVCSKDLTPPVGLKTPLMSGPHAPSLRVPLIQAKVEEAEYDERGVPKTWKYLNEQEWIVDSIGRDIAEILCFAHLKRAGAIEPLILKTKTIDLQKNKYTYSLQPDSTKAQIERDFTLANFAWSPNNYAPFAEMLVKTFNLHASNSEKTPDDFVKRICSGDMHILIDENHRIATKLSAHPLDAELHEQAALLQAVFGLIDLSGGFCDTRVPLNRICAHLSLAKALREGKQNKCGELAEIALECLCSRDGIAVERCTELLKNESDSDIKSYLRAVKIRASGDYRYYDQANHTNLEELAYGMRSAWGDPYANLNYVKTKYPSTIPLKWMRILNQGLTTHESARLSVKDLMTAEKNDYLSDYNYFKRASISDFNLINSDLNLTQSRCLSTENGKSSLAPLSWNDIACFHSRHILWALLSQQHFLEHVASNDALTARLIEKANREFDYLTLFPFVMRKTDLGRAAQASFYARAQKVFLTHPELVTCSNWRLTNRRARTDRVKPSMVTPEKFFNPSIPFGTAYWYSDRKPLENCVPTLDELAKFKQLAPCDAGAARDYAIKKYGDNPTTDQWLEVYGSLAEFNFSAMQDVARSSAGNPERCIALLTKLAKFYPNAYFNLAEYCLVVGKTDDAVKFAEEGVAKCPDPYVVSNCTTWLTKYYLAHNMKEKTEPLFTANIAHRAESAYLQGALIAEKLGNFASAVALLQIADNRYGIPAALCAFYCRNRRLNEHFQEEAQKREANFFPDGMRMMQVTDFHGSPQRGVLVTKGDWMEPSSALERDCVMVAIDGIPIEDKSQLELITRLIDKSSAKITFWDGNKFTETEKKFGFSNDFNLNYQNYFGPRTIINRKVAGVVHALGDKSLAAISPDSFGANRCGILGLSFDQQHKISSVVSRMPASVAGLRAGDQIKKIDQVSIDKMSNREVSNRITGLIGSKVTLGIFRDGREFDVTMTRQHPIRDEDINALE